MNFKQPKCIELTALPGVAVLSVDTDADIDELCVTLEREGLPQDACEAKIAWDTPTALSVKLTDDLFDDGCGYYTMRVYDCGVECARVQVRLKSKWGLNDVSVQQAKLPEKKDGGK